MLKIVKKRNYQKKFLKKRITTEISKKSKFYIRRYRGINF